MEGVWAGYIRDLFEGDGGSLACSLGFVMDRGVDGSQVEGEWVEVGEEFRSRRWNTTPRYHADIIKGCTVILWRLVNVERGRDSGLLKAIYPGFVEQRRLQDEANLNITDRKYRAEEKHSNN